MVIFVDTMKMSRMITERNKTWNIKRSTFISPLTKTFLTG